MLLGSESGLVAKDEKRVDVGRWALALALALLAYGVWRMAYGYEVQGAINVK
jgi:hypothetical protein